MTETQTAARRRTGVVIGVVVVLLWSTTSSFVRIGAREARWQFVALAAGLGGLAQIVAYGFWKRDLRRRLALPPRLWCAVIFGFVLYGLLYNWALFTSADEAQTCGVNLINYLWPIATVVCSVLWVPGVRLTWRLGAALALCLAGLAMGNADLLCGWRGSRASAWPYVAVAIAALAWGVYSSLLARWRDWADGYATAPVGSVVLSAVAAGICTATGGWRALDARELALIATYALGPAAAGYMLWELALHRARPTVLGMMSAAIPIISTALLCVVQDYRPSAWLIAGAVFVGAAVLLAIRRE